jgi:RNA polymerase sigma factor (sigma-70 family)
MRNYSDSDILEGIIRGDTDVIDYIYQSSYRSVRKYVKDNNGDEQDAEDMFQEALMIIYKKIQNNNFELSASFSTYLFSVAKYIWFNELRRRKTRGTIRKEPDEFEDLYKDLGDVYIEVERNKLFEKHFATLPDHCKKLLRCVFEGLSLEEITKEMNYTSQQHTKNRRLKCKIVLYKKITNDPKFKELKNEQHRDNNQIPRW